MTLFAMGDSGSVYSIGFWASANQMQMLKWIKQWTHIA